MPITAEQIQKLPACITEGFTPTPASTPDDLRAYVQQHIDQYRQAGGGTIQTPRQLMACRRYLKWLDLLDYKPGLP